MDFVPSFFGESMLLLLSYQSEHMDCFSGLITFIQSFKSAESTLQCLEPSRKLLCQVTHKLFFPGDASCWPFSLRSKFFADCLSSILIQVVIYLQLFSFHSGKLYFPTAGYYLAKQEFSYEIVTNLVQIFLRVSARIVDYLSCTQSLNSFVSFCQNCCSLRILKCDTI